MGDWWDQLNQGISDTGILQAINPFVRDVIPGVAAAEDVLGIDPSTWGAQGGATQVSGAGGAAGIGTPPILGGATMDWTQMGVPAGLALSGPRRIYPYTGGVIPAGYRVAMRKARRPTQGYPGGTYLVPRRRMNPLNPHALMRAERRMASFTHWVKRHFTIASHAPRRKRRAAARRRRK